MCSRSYPGKHARQQATHAANKGKGRKAKNENWQLTSATSPATYREPSTEMASPEDSPFGAGFWSRGLSEDDMLTEVKCGTRGSGSVRS